MPLSKIIDGKIKNTEGYFTTSEKRTGFFQNKRFLRISYFWWPFIDNKRIFAKHCADFLGVKCPSKNTVHSWYLSLPPYHRGRYIVWKFLATFIMQLGAYFRKIITAFCQLDKSEKVLFICRCFLFWARFEFRHAKQMQRLRTQKNIIHLLEESETFLKGKITRSYFENKYFHQNLEWPTSLWDLEAI